MGYWLEGIQSGQILKWRHAFAMWRLLLPALYVGGEKGKCYNLLIIAQRVYLYNINRIPRLEQPATQLGGQEV